MKNVMIGIGLTLITVVVILILFTIYGQNTRQNEVEEALAVAVEQTLDNLKISKNYEVDDKDEFVADLMQNLVLAIESDSELEVNVLSVDTEKGLLDVEVVEKFKQPNGSTGEANYRKTVILEEFHRKEPNYYFVKFEYAKTEEAYKDGNFMNYKVFSISEGSNVIFPEKAPSQKAKNEGETRTFKGWSLTKPSSGNEYSPEIVSLTMEDGSKMTVTNELVFYAVFE